MNKRISVAATAVAFFVFSLLPVGCGREFGPDFDPNDLSSSGSDLIDPDGNGGSSSSAGGGGTGSSSSQSGGGIDQSSEGVLTSQVPQFIIIGADDNMGAAINWLVKMLEPLKNPAGKGNNGTFDGTQVLITFYPNGTYYDQSNIAYVWSANTLGHSIGNHTFHHIYVNNTTVDAIVEEIQKNEDLWATETTVIGTFADTLRLDTLTLPTQWVIGTGENPDSLYFDLRPNNKVRLSEGKIYTGYIASEDKTGTYSWTCDGETQLLAPPFDGNDLSYSAKDSLCWIFLKANEVWGYDYTELRRTEKGIVSRDSFFVVERTGNHTVPGLVRGYKPGFRAPYLSVSDNSMEAIRQLDFRYDCSVEAGWEEEYTAARMPFPFRLTNGYPSQGITGSYPELWEVPAAPLVLPPDDIAESVYDLPGFRHKLSAETQASGKITGLDWNLIYQIDLTFPEILATLQYNLEERLKGNRAPLYYGIHGQYYAPGSEDYRTLQTFLTEAVKHPEVRIVSTRQLLDWMENPIGLNGKKMTAP